MSRYEVVPIAYIKNDFVDKFGIPRQSLKSENNVSEIIFNEKYRDENAFRCLDGYSHIWLLWMFDKLNSSSCDNLTVRPPRLGGNKRVGVFATRSPYHPNSIGLSCVKIKCIKKTPEHGTVVEVYGADLLNGTPIIDIKPYIPFSDCFPDAKSGFAGEVEDYSLKVVYENLCNTVPDKKSLLAIQEILSQDPRPSYHNDADRIYGMDYGLYNIKFKVNGDTLIVLQITKTNGNDK